MSYSACDFSDDVTNECVELGFLKADMLPDDIEDTATMVLEALRQFECIYVLVRSGIITAVVKAPAVKGFLGPCIVVDYDERGNGDEPQRSETEFEIARMGRTMEQLDEVGVHLF